MPYVRDSFWKGREWISEAHMQQGALEWCTNVAGARHHRSLDGAQPLAVFRAVEAERLLALPPTPFELAGWSRPKVGTDCYAKVGRALYSVPWRLIDTYVDARESERIVEFFVGGSVVKTWARIDQGKQTDWNDYPPEKVAFFMRTPAWCTKRAAELGASVAAVVAALLEVNALHRLRSAQAVIRLSEHHDPGRLNAACARAMVVGDPSFRTVKGILAAGTELEDVPVGTVPAAPAHLHGPAGLFDQEGAAS